MSAESTVTAPTTRRSAVTFPTVAAAGGVCTSCTPAVVYKYCTLMCSVRLVLLVSATDEQQLLERETPNPTLSAAITHTRSVSHLSGAVSRDTSDRIGAPLLPIRVVAVRARTPCVSRLVVSALLIESSNVPPQSTAFEHGAKAPKMRAGLPMVADIARSVGHPSAQ